MSVSRATPARAESAASCAARPTDDTLRPLPVALARRAAVLFGLHDMTAAEIVRSTVVRCMDGRLYACNYGANLPCGKANVAAALPAGDDWCRQNPNADFIPAYITGHDSIYTWRCVDGAPASQGPASALDQRGFIGQYWKPIG